MPFLFGDVNDATVRVLRRNGNVSEPNFEDWRTLRHSFAAMAQTQAGPTPVAFGGEVAMTQTALVSKEFFDIFPVQPAMGRGFRAEEQRQGAPRVALVSQRFWRTRLGGQPLDDLSIRNGANTYTVIGVAPEAFGGLMPAVTAQMWIPTAMVEHVEPLGNQRDLALAYSPGVAAPCLAIEADPDKAADYTARALEAEEFGDKALVVQLEDMIREEGAHAEETERMLRDWPL